MAYEKPKDLKECVEWLTNMHDNTEECDPHLFEMLAYIIDGLRFISKRKKTDE